MQAQPTSVLTQDS